ncbi:MAG: CoA transferase [Sphingomonas sp.]|uniref:CaiB/BaiF CoA transferase family protein n=1 Tax=Sphingomonas sp. TaxID=28214 RepID=UPI001839AD9A|nr:carnitine dehydratase [Zymomonas sp.]MBA4772850.1 CoA transferase [Sphingomonas sp.]
MTPGDGKPMLSGVKVVDLTSVVFGPYATQTLADLGAEVIKVESPPAGDVFRWAGKPAATPGMGPGFMAINRGKQSVVLDLKNPDDLAVMMALLADADVFVSNVRGQGMERLGLDYDSVRRVRSDIIYVHCVGFGQDGPYADLPAYDDVIQAASGATSLSKRVDGGTAPRFIPSLIADKVSGLHGVYAVLAALIHRMRTGEGQLVEVPMLEAFTHFILLEHLGGMTFDPPNAPSCYARQVDPNRQPFPTSDGYVAIAAYGDRHWLALFELLGASAFLQQPALATTPDRFRNMALMYREVARLTPGLTTAELLVRCEAANLPARAARDVDDIMDDPHLHATGFFQRRAHPSEGDYFEMRPPVKFGAAPVREASLPPQLDEQGARIRAGEGLSDAG